MRWMSKGRPRAISHGAADVQATRLSSQAPRRPLQTPCCPAKPPQRCPPPLKRTCSGRSCLGRAQTARRGTRAPARRAGTPRAAPRCPSPTPGRASGARGAGSRRAGGSSSAHTRASTHGRMCHAHVPRASSDVEQRPRTCTPLELRPPMPVYHSQSPWSSSSSYPPLRQMATAAPPLLRSGRARPGCKQAGGVQAGGMHGDPAVRPLCSCPRPAELWLLLLLAPPAGAPSHLLMPAKYCVCTPSAHSAPRPVRRSSPTGTPGRCPGCGSQIPHSGCFFCTLSAAR